MQQLFHDNNHTLSIMRLQMSMWNAPRQHNNIIDIELAASIGDACGRIVSGEIGAHCRAHRGHSGRGVGTSTRRTRLHRRRHGCRARHLRRGLGFAQRFQFRFRFRFRIYGFVLRWLSSGNRNRVSPTSHDHGAIEHGANAIRRCTRVFYASATWCAFEHGVWLVCGCVV